MDYEEELAEYIANNTSLYTIDLKPYASLFFAEENCFLIPAEDGLYMKGSAKPILAYKEQYVDYSGIPLDLDTLVSSPTTVYINKNGERKLYLLSEMLSSIKFIKDENDLKYISAIKLMARFIVDYFKARCKAPIATPRFHLESILNETGIDCYMLGTFQEYFTKLEEDLFAIINNSYYNRYILNFTGSSFHITKEGDIRIEEWYNSKISVEE